MSTILKALRRVEEERPGAPAAPRRAMRGDFVAGSGAPPPRRGKRRRPNLKLWGSIGAVALLAALVWWRLPRPEPVEAVQPAPPARAERVRPRAEAPTAHAAPPQAAPPAQAPEPAPPPSAQAPPAPAPPAPATSDVPAEVAERLPPLGAALDAPPVAPESPPPPTPSPTLASRPPREAPPTRVAAPAPPAEVPAPSLAAPKPEPAVATKPKPKPAAVASVPAPKPPPVVAKPTAPPAPSAPAVEVERTSWHPKPERRIAWVRIEGSAATRELHEGDAVGALIVKEIRPSSVVFQHGAEEIQRRVGAR